MPFALVTGASGFVGSHLVDALRGRSWSVRALVRDTSDLRWIEGAGADLVRGEVTVASSLAPALDGVDVVFHAAGLVKAPNEAAYRRVNVTGTTNLVRAATAMARPPRLFVLVSSLAAGGPSQAGRPRREEDADAPQGPYGRSKLAQEVALQQGAGEMAWTILRPCAVYGPRDRSFLVLARMVRRGWIPRIGGGDQPVSVIHVRDLVEGALRAAESPRSAGRTYYLAHPEVTTWAAVGKVMARALGRRTMGLRVPHAVIPGVGFTVGMLARTRGRPSPLPRDRIRDLLAPAWTCDTARAKEELGFAAAVDLAGGVPELMSWYRKEGYL